MNIIQSFNQTMSYLETVLEGEVDEKRISQLSGYSYAMFRRIFSILTDTTLAEYMRLRKLTKSAVDLRASQDKVIDIALKYGYESPDSFTVAFKSFHGCTPSQVRKGKPYNVFSPIQLSLTIKGGRTMEISIRKKSAFAVAGIKLEDIDTSLCPTAWEQLFEQCAVAQLEQMGNGQSYGICFDVIGKNKLNYMAGYDVTNEKVARKMNLEMMEIPENEYAVVQLKGKIPDCIHEGWKYLMEVFFPEQGYRHSGDPDFEVYGEGNMYSPRLRDAAVDSGSKSRELD